MSRYFLAKDAGSVIREKQVYTGDETKADQIVATFLTNHAGWTVQEVNAATFAAAVLVPDPAPTRAQASAALNDLDENSVFIRAVLLVILDEINVIRALLPGPPAARTAAQLRTAITNKIAAGTADV